MRFGIRKIGSGILVSTADVSFAQQSSGSAVVVAKARLSTYVDGNDLTLVNKKLQGYSWISCLPKLRIVCLAPYFLETHSKVIGTEKLEVAVECAWMDARMQPWYVSLVENT